MSTCRHEVVAEVVDELVDEMQTRGSCREDLSRIQEATSSGAPVDALLLVSCTGEK